MLLWQRLGLAGNLFQLRGSHEMPWDHFREQLIGLPQRGAPWKRTGSVLKNALPSLTIFPSFAAALLCICFSLKKEGCRFCWLRNPVNPGSCVQLDDVMPAPSLSDGLKDLLRTEDTAYVCVARTTQRSNVDPPCLSSCRTLHFCVLLSHEGKREEAMPSVLLLREVSSQLFR